MLAAEGAYHFVVRVTGTLHHDAERTVVLNVRLNGELAAGHGSRDARGEEVVQCLYALLAQTLVDLERTLG